MVDLLLYYKMGDYDLTFEQLEGKYGKLEFMNNQDWVDSSGRIRRIAHTGANGDLMHEMEAGLLFHTIHDDSKLTFEELEDKYGKLTLSPYDYYIDSYNIIRRILPYTPGVR